ncbi:CsbD family protein [Streptomyces sp. DG1A-41]|uniref:CsbD family protein n=1 Tax=Streptomyces sp. DG1A-41 TaxID=3125779 RepID=UPI0030CC7BE0
MSVGQTIEHKTQELNGRTTRNRRLRREGGIDRVSGSLKRAADKAKDAFRR